jgi:Rrf2 family protein
MKVTTRSRYALRLLVQLARHYRQGPVSLRIIARDQQISAKYLGQLVLPLRKKGLIKSQSGTLGGYELARPPRTVTMRQVMEVFEPVTVPVPCVAHKAACGRWPDCPTRPLWAKLGSKIGSWLNTITLQDLLDEKI